MPKPYEALNPAILRKCFLEFAGAERYRRFVRSLGLTPNEDSKPARLRYWQEVLWTQFAESYPNAPMEVDLICKSVMWCYVHDVPLESPPGVDLSSVRYSAELESILIDQCPFACCQLNCSDCVQV